VINSPNEIKTCRFIFLVKATMSKQWRILVVQDEEKLNRSIVSSLQKDGYAVRGVASGAEAIRLLWAEHYDVVISDQRMPDSNGFDLLQWIRTYCPNTRMIMVASADSSVTRTQALENGVVSYLEKPIDLHVLKEELRRLLQQTGFSASLDSFDLLDVIQIVNMSHKSIAMMVHTGLEEQGLLGFQEGELVWAEYGALRGEEAFFALAAHKNGTVTHQPWNKQVTPNVTQPLSRLIFQALQYRSKYADFQQPSGEQIAVTSDTVSSIELPGDDDDRPFLFAEPSLAQQQAIQEHSPETPLPQVTDEPKEWWQKPVSHTRSHKLVDNGLAANTWTANDQPSANGSHTASDASSIGANIPPTTVPKTPELPSWLIDQPTNADMPVLRLSSLSGADHVQAKPAVKTSPTKWRPAPLAAENTRHSLQQHESNSPLHQQSSPELLASENSSVSQPKSTDSQGTQLRSLASARKTDDLSSFAARQVSVPLTTDASASLSTDFLPGNTTIGTEKEQSLYWEHTKTDTGSQRASKRNYSAVVTALQTLGYSTPGFIATAVVSLEGQPIAQVAVDDLDISPMCGYFSSILRGTLLSLDQGAWGYYEHSLITSATHHVLLRLVGSNRDTFQVLIISREANPVESLEAMANIEPAIASAL
jgi:DNA-binding response OmpR family regulator/predicted regulator of Ras-like GTPase activity (Roadblock/LC7/MglB family)